MATFLKESYFNGKNATHFKQSLYYDISQDTSTNKSTITYYAYVGSVDNYSASGSTSTVYINGDSVGTFTSLAANSSGTLRGSKTVTVSHNSDGTATASYSMTTDTSWTLGDANLSGSFTLPTIPRKAKITSFSVSKRDETSVTFSYTTDSTIDYAWYSKDDGNTWTTLPSTKIVSGLSAGTTYNFKLSVRRQDSQMLTISDRKQQSTYPYPTINSAPNFIIGNNLTIGLTNPLNRSCTLYIIGDDNTVASSTVTTNGTSTTNGFNSSYWKDFFYSTIPNKKTGTYKVRIVCSAVSRDTTITGGTYSVTTNEIPIVTTTGQDTGKTLVDSINPTATTTDLTNDNTKIIKFISDVSVSASAVAQNYASIYFIGTRQGTGATTSGSPNTYRNVESVDFTGSAVDTRSLYGESPITGLTLIDYIKLTLDNIELYKDDQTSNTLKCRGDGDYYTGKFGTNGVNNSIVFKLRYKEHSASTWSSWSTKTMTIGTNEYTFDFQVGTNFDYTKAYDFEFDIRDKCMGLVATQTSKPGIPVQGLFESYQEAFGTKTFENTSNGVVLNSSVIPLEANEWKTLDTDVSYETDVAYPSSFNELFVEIHLKNSSTASSTTRLSCTIPKIAVINLDNDEKKDYRIGASFTTSTYFGAVVRAYNNQLHFRDTYWNGSLISQYSTMNVYYR